MVSTEAPRLDSTCLPRPSEKLERITGFRPGDLYRRTVGIRERLLTPGRLCDTLRSVRASCLTVTGFVAFGIAAILLVVAAGVMANAVAAAAYSG
ncbi:hypothetical protein [Nocardia asteroides]|uniref:hypothetical protein n=1 Tax=Nocardia asteroides TaxID=1824 RepID=UPI001E36F8E9|nr:hypothetical protein [Nocardia asteroides]UGT55165.1 hypothetical protein LTT85_32045 [Nocardia asteroides]